MFTFIRMAKIISFEEIKNAKKRGERANRHRSSQGAARAGAEMSPERMERLRAAFGELMSFAQDQEEMSAFGGVIQVEETGLDLKFRLPVPGFQKDEMRLIVKDNILTLKLYKIDRNKLVVNPKSIDKTEKAFMTQSIPLPHPIEVDQTKAVLKDKVLEVSLRKKVFLKQESRFIEIQEEVPKPESPL